MARVEEKVVCAAAYPEGEFEINPFITLINWPLDFLYIFEDGQIDPVALEESLRKVLEFYPPFAGRIMHGLKMSNNKDGHSRARVVMNNAGVKFKVVSDEPGSARGIPSWEVGPKKGKYSHIPNMRKVAQGLDFLTTIQLTCFKEGGCALGVTINHLVADGWTFAMFMKDWSDVHNLRAIRPTSWEAPAELMAAFTPSEAKAFAARKGLKGTSGVEKCMTKAMFGCLVPMMLRQMATSQQQPRTCLHFNDGELKALKSAAEMESGSWVSTNEALLGHLHPILVDVFGNPARPLSKPWISGAAVPVNCRGKVSGFDKRCIGNYVAMPRCVYNIDEVGVGGAVHDVMRRCLTEQELLDEIKMNNYQMAAMDFYNPTNGTGGFSPCPGFIGQWNYEGANPTYDVDFGAGLTSRSNPWTGDAVKIMKGLPQEGGLRVMISHDRRGVLSWTKSTPLHSKRCCPFKTYESAQCWACLAIGSEPCLPGIGAAAKCGIAACLAGVWCLLGKLKEKKQASYFEQLKEHPQLHPTVAKVPSTSRPRGPSVGGS